MKKFKIKIEVEQNGWVSFKTKICLRFIKPEIGESWINPIEPPITNKIIKVEEL